jgi:Mor family transcriptional regulator
MCAEDVQFLTKRKHKALTKAEIINKTEKGEKLINLAKEYGVGRATIYDIGKNRYIKINLFRLFPVIRRFR